MLFHPKWASVRLTYSDRKILRKILRKNQKPRGAVSMRAHLRGRYVSTILLDERNVHRFAHQSKELSRCA